MGRYKSGFRYAAAGSSPAGVSVTTVGEDGSTTLKPGETVETGSGGAVTNNGDDVTLKDNDGNTTVTPTAEASGSGTRP